VVDEEEGEAIQGEQKWDWPFKLAGDVRRMSDTPEEIKLGMDAQHFAADDLEVRTEGRDVLVRCMHEHEADDYGPVGLTEEFVRRVRMPDNVNMDSVRTHLKRDGTLLIEAKKLASSVGTRQQ